MMKPFDLFSTFLDGVNLIEASAGTGKTYTLEGLYIRLLLEKTLPPDRILVVTFTKTATEELKSRIRKKLVRLKDGLTNPENDDGFIREIIDHTKDPHQARELIRDALADFDKAAIYTIHGFCQRILQEFAFETDNSFDSEVSADPSSLFREIAEDFWRKSFYDAPGELVRHGVDSLKGPAYFADLLKISRQSDLRVIPRLKTPTLDSLNDFRNLYGCLKKEWRNSRLEVLELLKAPALSGIAYGGLNPEKSNPAICARDIKVRELGSAMDAFTSEAGLGLPLFPKFDLFTEKKIIAATRKKQPSPVHRFFTLCDEFQAAIHSLTTEMDQYLLYLKQRFLTVAKEQSTEKKKKTNLIHFDDLLERVDRALHQEGGDRLADKIRQKYEAALVDEFQDTDSIQYRIFYRLFSPKGRALFFIGDPKQAIYGFRGADIFSYMEAFRNADHPYTLLKNYRSHPSLIAGVNRIFSNRPHPFLFKTIAFEETASGVSSPEKTTYDPGLILWHMFSDTDQDGFTSISKSDAMDMITSAMASEINRLGKGPEAVSMGDIAILVRTNSQAQFVQRRFSSRRIPSVIYQSGNIFESSEALELRRVLLGIAFPADIRRVKAALTTDLLGASGNGEEFQNDSVPLEIKVVQFKRLCMVWKDQGFMRMFRRLMSEEQLKQRIMTFPDGNRRLTNLQHLCEILHQQDVEGNPGPMGLTKWLNEQITSVDNEVEEHLLRLESDKNAVNILTIHKSKGLEFPIVFCPFPWDATLPENKPVKFHDPDYGNRLTLDLGSMDYENHRKVAATEQLAENLRLFYVALTRAKTRCYLAWGRINDAPASAPAYLFHYNGDMGENGVEPLIDAVSSKTDRELFSDLLELTRSGDISLEKLPSDDLTQVFPRMGGNGLFSFRNFPGNIPRSFQISSYSALTASRQADDDVPDRDGIIRRLPDDDVSGDQAMADFPRGTRAGLFFHDVLENITFTEPDPRHHETVIAEKLGEYGIDPAWTPLVRELLAKVVSTPLLGKGSSLTLSSISATDRIHEMEFYFPIEHLSPKTLADAFRTGGADLSFPIKYSESLEKLKFIPFNGFIKGFVDMIFCHNSRYYLVDWKSNYLGPGSESYNKEAIAAAMVEHHYVLQYHLYVLALRKYLLLTVTDFQYSTHFGGVFYLFIRGMDPEKDEGYGIFYDRPSPEILNSLESALTQDPIT